MSARALKQPQDRSLKAFKEWFGGRYQLALRTKNTTLTSPWFTENEWIKNWKLYWSKVDGLSKGKKGGR